MLGWIGILALSLQGSGAEGAPESAPASERFQLENGLRVLLHPVPEAPAAVVMLGVRAGVHDEPEGCSGLAHLAEHIFFHGGTERAAPGRTLELLARGGPLGETYADANAETLWDLTYFYALRKPGEIELPLELFAQKLAGVEHDDELLELERAKALEEIAGVEAAMEASPALRSQLAGMYRRMKAGDAGELRALGRDEVDAFLAAHYRPERALLLVEGAFDPERARLMIRERFAALRGREASGPAEVAREGAAPVALWSAELGVERRDDPALRVLVEAWKRALRPHGRAYVELSGGGTLRAVLLEGDAERLRSTLEALREPLSERELRLAVRAAASEMRQLAVWIARELPAPGDPRLRMQAMAQRALERLRFEAAGGQALLERLEGVEPSQVAELARSL